MEFLTQYLQPPTCEHSTQSSDGSKLLARQSRQADSHAAMSGYGHHKIIYCPEGVPVEQAIFGILAAFGASFALLFRAVSLARRKRRKRRRSANEMQEEFQEYLATGEEEVEEEEESWLQELGSKISDVYWWGRCMFWELTMS